MFSLLFAWRFYWKERSFRKRYASKGCSKNLIAVGGKTPIINAIRVWAKYPNLDKLMDKIKKLRFVKEVTLVYGEDRDRINWGIKPFYL